VQEITHISAQGPFGTMSLSGFLTRIVSPGELAAQWDQDREGSAEDCKKYQINLSGLEGAES